MKKLILITTPLLLAACSHDTPPALTQMPAQSSLSALPTETTQQGQYIALPGQAAVDTNAAFDQHAAAYTAPVADAAATVAVATETTPAAVQPVTVPVATPTQPVMQTTSIPTALGTAVVMTPVTTPAIPQTTPVYGVPATPLAGAAVAGAAVAGASAYAGIPVETTPVVMGPVDYTLRITNATSGRIFVEAQDAAGEIYPCGFMTGSQSISSEKKQANPIKGPITVVVRDPDKPDAPELRRYKVDPPTDYAGKTVEITIISGGFYQVSVDGKVRYITPTPVGKPDLGNAATTSPAEAAAAEAAKAAAEAAKVAADAAATAPADAAAPAPEQEPAGM